MTDLRCPKCNALLGKKFSGTIEIKCAHCKTIVSVERLGKLTAPVA